MKILRAILLCAGLATPVFASAGIIYEWRTSSTSDSIYAVSGFIELSDAAVQAGSVDYQFSDICGGDPQCDYGDAASPILRFSFMVNNAPIALDIEDGAGFYFGPGSGAFGASFAVGAWTLGPMQLYANDGNSHVWLDGSLIADANSDIGGCGMEGCNGAAGGFFRIPEPGSALLIGAGLLGLAGMRRRRQLSR